MSLFSGHAFDIDFTTKNDFFEAIGYLSKPGVIMHFEAQVPEDKISLYTTELPGHSYYPISNDELTSGGNKMKNGIQLRIYLGHKVNIPLSLKPQIVKGNRINRGLFAEKLLRDFGFVVGYYQNPTKIRNIVLATNPMFIPDFDRGYSL